MAITITLATDETFTLDETSGLQHGADGTPNGPPRPDSDVNVATLPGAFSTYLFTTLGLSNAYPTAVGVASSSTTFIRVQSDAGPLATLGLTDADGDPFTGTTALDATSSGLFTTSGNEIFLISDDVGGTDNQVVLGKYDSDGDDTLDAVAFAVYMKTDGTLGTDEYVQLWSVTFTAIDHPLAGDGDPADEYDDAIDLLSLVSLTATGSKTFNFDNLPSGQNLFGIVGDVNDGLVVVGANPILNADGTYTTGGTSSDTVNTSKGGGNVTIGVNNQAFNPGEGAFFTYVSDPVASFLGGFTPGGLSQGEADDADNVQFGSTNEVGGAFLKIVQVTGGGTASMILTAYDSTVASTVNGAGAGDDLNARNFVTGQMGASGTEVAINSVTVYNGTIDDANIVTTGITVVIDGSGVATVSGLQAGYIVAWTTTADHDQVLVEANTGSAPFDIGLFGITEGAEQSQSLAGRAFIEDDSPGIGNIPNSTVAFTAGANSGAVGLLDLPGTDGQGSLQITNFESTLTLLGRTIEGHINGARTEVKYFEDLNSNDILDGTDVHWYTLSITQNATAADSYTFTVVNAPAAPPLEFNFAGLPSGQNLFGMVAQAGSPNGAGIVFFSDTADIKDPGNGEMDKGSGTINTSQGGGPTTIGTNNQMIDPGEGIFFSFINDPLDAFLANVTNGLDQNEADDADNMQFASLREVAGAFMRISQTQGSEVEACTVEAFNITSSAGRGLIGASGQPAAHVDILSVSVWSDSFGGNLLEQTVAGADGGLSTGITLTIDADGVAHVTGLETGYVVSWTTDGNHDQALVTGTDGKFDIGGFGLSEPQVTPDHDLDFEVTLTDGNGDTAVDTFTLFINA